MTSNLDSSLDDRRWARHEVLLVVGTLAAACVVAKQADGGWIAAAILLFIPGVCAGCLLWSATVQGAWGDRLCVLATTAWIVSAYTLIEPVIEACFRIKWDGALRAADERLFGSMPVTWIPRGMPAWIGEVFSIGYILFHVYLLWAVVDALAHPGWYSRMLMRQLSWTYLLGLAGYLVVPAVGPKSQFPELVLPYENVGPIGRWVADFVRWGSSHYDAFPSLHILVPAALVHFDWRWNRQRLTLMSVPIIGIVGSTIVLRYHYVVDLLAAAVLIVVLIASGMWSTKRESSNDQRRSAAA